MQPNPFEQALNKLKVLIQHFGGQPAPGQAAKTAPPRAQTEAKWQAQGYNKGSDGVWRQSPAATTAPTQTPSPTASPFAQAENNFQFDFSGNYPNAEQQVAAFYNKRPNAPLSKFQKEFVDAARKYKVDPRLLPMIGQIESSSGVKYPQETFNPFGYRGGPDNNRLSAGFTSIPHAIDALTARFTRAGTPQGYANFRAQPTIQNLQRAYNANPAEEETYLKNGSQLINDFQ